MSLVEQWQGLKRQHPDALLMIQLGDFYELLFDDAGVAASALNLTLTRRGRHDGKPIPLCGVPLAAAAAHIGRLTALGFTVAVADQVGPPPGDRSPIRRVLRAVFTPATSLEDSGGNAGRSTFLAAVVCDHGGCAIAVIDVHRLAGQRLTCDASQVETALAPFDPAEILAGAGVMLGVFADRRVKGPLPRAGAAASLAQIAETQARGYLAAMQGGPVAAAIQFDIPTPTLSIDAASRGSLGLAGKGRLQAAVNRTVGASGGRLLTARLLRPASALEIIEGWQADWAPLAHDTSRRTALRRLLADVPDFERSVARTAATKPGPQDLAVIARALGVVGRAVSAGVLDREAVPSGLTSLHAKLEAGIGASPPTAIRAGHDPVLDRLRDDTQSIQAQLAELETTLAGETGIQQLKIRYHAQIGYLAEVPGRFAGKLHQFDEFQLRQGLVAASRFAHPRITALNDGLIAAGEAAAAREAALLGDIAAAVAAQAPELMRLAHALAALDVAQSSATLVREGAWCRPHLTAGREFQVKGLRHPELDATLTVVPNDCDLSPGRQIMLLTGPNMAGKSTFLRQNALAVVFAQAGLPVPAASACIGVVDAVFSRVGTSDDLVRGRSTFMVEMMETAAILTGASQDAFVVVDEIGRGTSTQDGLAIAQAVLESLHDDVRCRTLFATHFLELAEAAKSLPRVRPCAMRVRESRDGIVFLHEVGEGASSRSFGVHVASLAGVPKAVIARAAHLLLVAERARPVHELPLFSARPVTSTQTEPPGRDSEADALRDALDRLDADQLTPLQALQALYDLKLVRDC